MRAREAEGDPGRDPRRLREVSTAPSVWVRLFLTRLREPAFWAIQGAVLAITALHLLFEALDLFGDASSVEAGLHNPCGRARPRRTPEGGFGCG